jgi:hypothetical protein
VESYRYGPWRAGRVHKVSLRPELNGHSAEVILPTKGFRGRRIYIACGMTQPNSEFEAEPQDWDGPGWADGGSIPESYNHPILPPANPPANPQNRGPQTTYFNPEYRGSIRRQISCISSSSTTGLRLFLPARPSPPTSRPRRTSKTTRKGGVTKGNKAWKQTPTPLTAT